MQELEVLSQDGNLLLNYLELNAANVAEQQKEETNKKLPAQTADDDEEEPEVAKPLTQSELQELRELFLL